MLVRFLLVILFSPLALANPQTELPANAESTFVSGIGAYQKGEFETARDLFKEAASHQPDNEVIFYNWGLSEMHLENFGWSVALLRKALALSPSFKEAQKALEFVKDKLPNPVTEYNPEGLDAFRANVLNHAPWHLLLTLGLVFLLISGLCLIQYFGRRKQAFLQELPLPKLPIWGGLAASIFAFLLFCMGLKTFELFEVRATLVVDVSKLHTGPSIKDTVLFEVFAGQDLFLSKKHDDWLQVKIPGGVSGWLPAKDLFLTTESRL